MGWSQWWEKVRILNETPTNQKDRCNALWKINCESTIQYQTYLAEKENELSRLRACMSKVERTSLVLNYDVTEGSEDSGESPLESLRVCEILVAKP